VPSVSVHSAIAEIGRQSWDGLSASSGNPFVSFDFSGYPGEVRLSSRPDRLVPLSPAAHDDGGALIGVMPLYLKSHSQANTSSTGPGPTPMSGPAASTTQTAIRRPVLAGHRATRLIGGDQAKPALLAGALEFCNRIGASGVHITFPAEDDWRLLGQQGLLQRQD